MDKENYLLKITNKKTFNEFIKEHPDFEYRKQDVILRMLAHVPIYVFRDAHGKLRYTLDSPKSHRTMH